MRKIVVSTLLGLGLALTGLTLSATAWGASGAKLYADNCAGCHGPSGKGDGANGKSLKAADLTSSSLSLTQIMSIVRDGKGPYCPSWRSSMNDGEIQAVSKHAKGLQR